MEIQPPQFRNRLYGISSTPPPSKTFGHSTFGKSMPASASKVMPQPSSSYILSKPLPCISSSADLHLEPKLPFMGKLKRALSFSQKHKTRKNFKMNHGTSAWIAESPADGNNAAANTTFDSSEDTASYDDVFIDESFDSSFSQSDSPTPKQLQQIGAITVRKREIEKNISNIYGRIELRKTSIAALEKMLDFEKQQLKGYQNDLIESKKAFEQLCDREEKLMQF
uniref:Uncharacterized protein n=1 Tax=Panagrolaimus sp. PS1159 TaxID=55785 RepID=A0AC35FEW3_9BILA